MNFSDFVKTYWKKLRRSGAPWVTIDIVTDSGLARDVVDAYTAYCASNPPLTDDQLIDQFNSTMQLAQTPFGATVIPKSAPWGAGTVGQLSISDFTALMKSILKG